MYGVSRISTTENIMLINFINANATLFSNTLNTLADNGVVVDMISQTASSGGNISFSFTASFSHFDTAVRALSKLDNTQVRPMISGGYSKLNLFGEEMVESVGVAAHAIQGLKSANVDIIMITTSDLDISLLVRQEDEDVALFALLEQFKL